MIKPINSNRQGIKSSNIFLVVGTENYFKDIPVKDIEYAKKLNKPFRVMVYHDVKVPSIFKENVKDYKEFQLGINQEITDIEEKELKQFLEFIEI